MRCLWLAIVGGGEHGLPALPELVAPPATVPASTHPRKPHPANLPPIHPCTQKFVFATFQFCCIFICSARSNYEAAPLHLGEQARLHNLPAEIGTALHYTNDAFVQFSGTKFPIFANMSKRDVRCHDFSAGLNARKRKLIATLTIIQTVLLGQKKTNVLS